MVLECEWKSMSDVRLGEHPTPQSSPTGAVSVGQINFCTPLAPKVRRQESGALDGTLEVVTANECRLSALI